MHAKNFYTFTTGKGGTGAHSEADEDCRARFVADISVEFLLLGTGGLDRCTPLAWNTKMWRWNK